MLDVCSLPLAKMLCLCVVVLNLHHCCIPKPHVGIRKVSFTLDASGMARDLDASPVNEK